MKRFITYLQIAIVLCALAGCRHKREEVHMPSGNVFEVSETVLAGEPSDTLRMGTVREGEKVTMGFSLKNGFSGPFVVEKIVSGCGCTLFGYSRKPIKPGESANMEVTFNSAGFYGEVIKEAKIYTSVSATPYKVIVEATIK